MLFWKDCSENRRSLQVTTCLICCSQLKESISSATPTDNPQKLYDVSCKYLHSAITTELVANGSGFSNEGQYPSMCEKCCSSAVELVDLTQQLEYLQKTVAESTLIYSLGVLHRRRKNREDWTENSEIDEGCEFSGGKLLEFDVSVFPDCDFGTSVPNTHHCLSPSVVQEEFDSGNNCEDDVDGPVLISISSNNIEIPVHRAIKTENVWSDSDSEDCHCIFEAENIYDQRNYPQTTEEHGKSPEPILQSNNSMPSMTLKRLDPAFISKAIRGEIKLGVKERIRRRKIYPAEENYTFKNKKRNRNGKKYSIDPNKLCHRRGRPKKQPHNLSDRRKVGRPKKSVAVHVHTLPLLSIPCDSSTPVTESMIHATTSVNVTPVQDLNIESGKCISTVNGELKKRKIELPKKYKSIYNMGLKIKKKSSFAGNDSCQPRKRGRPRKQVDAISVPLVKTVANVDEALTARPVMETGDPNLLIAFPTEEKHHQQHKRGRPRKTISQKLTPGRNNSSTAPLGNLKQDNIVSTINSETQNEIEVQNNVPGNKPSTTRGIIGQPKKSSKIKPLVLKIKSTYIPGEKEQCSPRKVGRPRKSNIIYQIKDHGQ